MKSLNDIIRIRADSLNMGRENQLEVAQRVLNDLYPGKTRARRLKSGVLTIETPSAAVANDVRLQQEEILKRCEDQDIQSIKIRIT